MPLWEQRLVLSKLVLIQRPFPVSPPFTRVCSVAPMGVLPIRFLITQLVREECPPTFTGMVPTQHAALTLDRSDPQQFISHTHTPPGGGHHVTQGHPQVALGSRVNKQEMWEEEAL